MGPAWEEGAFPTYCISMERSESEDGEEKKRGL